MIDVTGVMVLSPVTSSSVIKHLPLLDTNMVNRHRGGGGGGAAETLPV